VNPANAASDPPKLGDYTRILRRRAWVVAIVAAVALAAGILYDVAVTPLYQASSEVVLARDSLAATLTSKTGANDKGDPERFVQTQLEVAQAPSLARQVLDATGLRDRSPKDLVAGTEFLVPTSADVLQFRVRDPSAALAARLANEYAAQFAAYQRGLDETAINAALTQVQARIQRLRTDPSARAAAGPGVISSLVAKQRQLLTLEPLETGKALRLSAAPELVQVRPNPARDIFVALVTGLLLGVVLAFVVEALDRRVESLDDVAEGLGLPLLGQIPRRAYTAPAGLSMTARGNGRQAEFQALGSNVAAALQVAGLDESGAAVMLASAQPGDGSATAASNLGAALALAGKRTIIVDLNRSPSLHRVFGVPERPGLIDVATRRIAVDDALVRLPDSAYLSLLPLGGPAGELGRLLSTDAVPNVINQLRSRADVVLIDGPPLTDPDAPHAGADALIVVLDCDGLHERAVRRARSALERPGPARLGFVARMAAPPERFAPAAVPAAPEAAANGHLDAEVASASTIENGNGTAAHAVGDPGGSQSTDRPAQRQG
jgi:polysaccharide biosynthesis transport protein